MLPTLLTKLANKRSNRSVFTKTVRFSLVALLALSLTACGFHLRGNIPLSDGLKNLYLSAPEGSFKDQLESRLIRLGATLAATPQAADAILNVTKAQSNRTVGTLDERGKVNSYNINFAVAYTLQDLAGNAIRPNANVRESRRYNFDPQAVLESESEEADLIEDMEDEAVLKIIRKLAAITDFDPNAVEKAPVEQKASEQGAEKDSEKDGE